MRRFEVVPTGIALVYCAVLEDEVAALLGDAPYPVKMVQMPQGLHNDPPKLREGVQAMIDDLEDDLSFDTIVLGYGLCSRGTEGLTSKRCTLVLPRAHDCITLLLGSKETYAHEIATHPGTYWYSPGWNRHHLAPGEERHQTLLNHYVEKYGEENAEFLMEQEQHWFDTYDRAAFVHHGVGGVEEHRSFTQKCAHWLGWKYGEIAGNPDLLRALICGPWDDERFLVIPPGKTLRLVPDGRVVELADAS